MSKAALAVIACNSGPSWRFRSLREFVRKGRPSGRIFVHWRLDSYHFAMKRLVWMTSIALSLMATEFALCDGEDAAVLSLPLTDGRIAVRDIVQPLAQRLNIEDLAPLDALNWTIDVRSLAGRLRLTAIERLTDGAVELTIKPDALEITFDEPRIAKAAADASTPLAKWVAGTLKYDPNRVSGRFGLSFITADNARAAATDLSPEMRDRVVVLVHGMDDPGVMWTDLIPALHAEGFTVARFEYPNDGPIAESADLLAHELERARAAGVERLDIVAHSMGGLVVRDVLTRRSYMNGDGSGGADARFPAVDRFIMCGTPNRGSELARLRSVVELREHLLTALATHQSYRELSRDDGNGEAGRDLLPDSEFLRRLNARPLPSHTRISIIAGRRIPLSGGTVKWLAGKTRSLAGAASSPDWLKDAANSRIARAVENVADEAVESIGDGCVSLDSARLGGVDDFTIVRAGHLGMLLNIHGERTPPPALPIILNRLKAGRGLE